MGIVERGRVIGPVRMPCREDGGDSAHGKEKEAKGAERELEKIRGIRRGQAEEGVAWFKMK